MITEGVLAVLALFSRWLERLLPVSTLNLEAVGSIGDWVGEKMGPADQVLPMREAAQGLVIVTGVWMPAALTYTVVKWIYRHLPVVGKG